MFYSVVLAVSALIFSKLVFAHNGDSLYFDFFDRDYRNSRSWSDEDFTETVIIQNSCSVILKTNFQNVEEGPGDEFPQPNQPNFRTSKFLTSRKTADGINARNDELTFPNIEHLFATSDVNEFDTAASTTTFHSSELLILFVATAKCFWYYRPK